MKRPGWTHAPEADALAVLVQPATGPLIELRAPMPGLFAPSVAPGDLVTAGATIGDLVVLGRATGLLAPRATGGTAVAGIAVRTSGTGVRAVAYGDFLVALDPALRLGGDATLPSDDAPTATSDVAGLVFRAPTSGRFYGRSAPDKPAFVEPGAQLTAGATICLLEVMKTFHRVTYGGPGLPDTARVTRVLVADGADVNAGDPLLALESPLST
jgi:acetyl-CoA carboxylase biotin carboxyl carrier protein